MFKANVGSSTAADARAAGKEAAAQAAAGLDATEVALVYCSCDYDVDEVVAGVGEALPDVPVLGNTSFTGVVVSGAGYVGGDTPFVGVMALSDPDMTVGVAAADRSENSDPVAAGAALATAAMEAAERTDAPDFFYMAASPAEEEFYLKGISSVVGRIPFFGGSAADNSIAGEWKLYTTGESFADGCVAAFFWNAPDMTNVFTGAYRETEDFGVITKIDGNRTLVEIDGVPAAKKFQEWTGCSDEDIAGGNLLAYTVCSPLGVKDRLGDLIAIRHPMNGNDDFSINVGNNLAEKTCVIRMEATVDELIQSVPDTLRELIDRMPGDPVAFHLVHCGGRRAGIDARIGEVADAVAEVCGDVPYLMEFTFGEYGFEDDNNNTCGGLMLSFTGFSA
ncbi:FIST signal transduction protein [uncultured Adlercreutzia sp.]|uniref:FIST signal transduction protein n=1 Tax=uncultured Adlercreutzia sp. TaxID=875803 RepID=UPI0025FDDD13|nr:FIST N-terminal domain-containing protein [uncultured Adlercreutzia sp.]